MLRRHTSQLAGFPAVAALVLAVSTWPLPSPASAGVATPQGTTGAAKGGARPSPADASAEPSADQASRLRYGDLYREFLGVAPHPLGPASSPRRPPALIEGGDLDEIAQRARDCHYEPLEFMIALVSDPIDSGLVSDFDLTMNALQRAMADAGYRHDRQWLPWIEPESAETKTYRQIAGMMLFHGLQSADSRRWPTDPRRHLLALFLVGETPKLGIHKAAFQRTVDFILALHRADRAARHGAQPPPLAAPGIPEIPVLGPASSGSVESLRIALGLAAGARFRIVSGSASAPHIEERLQEGDLAQRVRFSRTIVADDELAERGLRFLQDRLGWDLDRAALLVESDTAYGSYLSRARQPLLARITKLSFPSGLFALRNAWEKLSAAAPAAVDSSPGDPKPPAPPKSALDVTLEDQRTPVDLVPEMSPLTARIADMAISNLLRQISRDGVRYVGILATDVKDQLFLAEQIRRWAPNVILFVVDDNLLYVHPQYSTTMFGTLTISSFPLLVEDASFRVPPVTPELKLRRQFASERQEGTYLAALQLMGRLPAERAVWIAASGHYGMWPLARFRIHDRGPRETPPLAWGPEATSPLGPRLPIVTFPPEIAAVTGPPAGFDLTLEFLLAVLCVVSYLLRLEALAFTRAVLAFTLPRDQLRACGLLSAAAALLALAGAGIVELWIAWLQASTVGQRRWWVVLAFLLLGYGILLGALIQASRVYRRQWFEVVVGIVAAALPLLPWALSCLWTLDDSGFLAFREGRFTGGLSPLTALGWLTAGVFFWVIVELKRQLVLCKDDTSWPLWDGREPPLAGCQGAASALRAWFRPALPCGVSILAILVVLAPVVFLWNSIQPIGESRLYGRIFLVLGAAIGVLALVPFIRLLRAWSIIRDLLRRLAMTTPLFTAIQGVAGEVRWQPLHFKLYVPSFAGMQRSVERLRALLPESSSRQQEVKRYFAKLMRSLVRAERSAQENRLRKTEGSTFLSPLRLWRRVAERQQRYYEELGFRRLLMARFHQAYARTATTHGERVDEFYAVRLIVYFQQIFHQLRYWTMASMGTGLLLIAGVASYAFEPKRFTMLVLWAMFAAVSGWTLVIFLQMHRNPALSAIGQTEAGKITFDWPFVRKLLAYGLVPVLGLAGSQFPGLDRLIGSLIDPLARVLRIN
jgi:hypothetical protein